MPQRRRAVSAVRPARAPATTLANDLAAVLVTTLVTTLVAGLLAVVAGAGVAAAGVVGDRLAAGSALAPGDSLRSADGVYSLVLQGDGNVVEYAGGRALWATGTAGRGGTRLVLQGDGNLVLYAAAGRAVWASARFASGPTTLVLRGDGGLVAVTGAGVEYWGVHPRADLLASNAVLRVGQTLWSPSAQYRLVLQTDGNLVLYAATNVPVWWSDTSGAMSALVMQPDGDLVLRRADGGVAWHAGSSGAGSTFAVTDDASGVVSAAGAPVWRTPAQPATLWRNQVLRSGALLAQGTVRLVMQTDGNLVRYVGSAAAWATGTRSPGARLAMQSDGNLVVYSAAGAALWWTGTARTTATYLRLSPAGLAHLGNTSRVPNWIEGPPKWTALAQCESSGNPRAVNPAGYYGLYQFSVPTWTAYGGTGNPVDATPAVQTAVASTLYLARGRQPWPTCGRYL